MKVNLCLDRNEWKLSERGQHIGKKSDLKSRGIAIVIQNLIIKILEVTEISPKRVLSKLIKDRKKNKLFEKDLLPSLKQVMH